MDNFNLKEIAAEFFENNPNGSLKEFKLFVKRKKAEYIEIKFNEYKERKLKELKYEFVQHD